LPAVAPVRVGAPGIVAVGGVLVLVAVGGAGVFVLVAVGGTGVFVAVPVGGTGVLVAVEVPTATVRVSAPETTLRLPASSTATAVMLYVPFASAVVIKNQWPVLPAWVPPRSLGPVSNLMLTFGSDVPVKLGWLVFVMLPPPGYRTGVEGAAGGTVSTLKLNGVTVSDVRGPLPVSTWTPWARGVVALMQTLPKMSDLKVPIATPSIEIA
jgi:hypothetical protein